MPFQFNLRPLSLYHLSENQQPLIDHWAIEVSMPAGVRRAGREAAVLVEVVTTDLLNPGKHPITQPEDIEVDDMIGAATLDQRRSQTANAGSR